MASKLTGIHYGDGSNLTGVNADLLDGIHASGFTRNVSLGRIGNTDVIPGSTAGWGNNPTGGTYTTDYVGHGGTVIMSADAGGSCGSLALEATYSGDLFYHSNTDSNRWTSHRVWTDNSDGAGSGLDADLLDGVQGTSYLRKDVASQEINGGTNTALELRCKNAGVAKVSAGRSTDGSQGTGVFEVSQDGNHGGGFYYNGDASPTYVSGETADTITFYRIQAGTRHRVFQYGYSSNNVSFTGAITAAGDVTAYSDERLKSDIVTIPNALETVSQLRGVNYTKDGEASTGVIAQEVEAVMPEVVHTADDEMGTKSVAYGNMMGVMIEAIKELKELVAAQQVEIEELRNGK